MADASTIAITSYVIESIRSTLIEDDPIYLNLVKRDGIASIVEQSIYDAGFSPAIIPRSEWQYVIALSKREIYMRLATNVAPEYDLEERSAKVNKDQRFQHYIKLVEIVEKQIKRMEEGGSGVSGSLEVVDTIIRDRDGGRRNYELSSAQSFTITADVTASDHVDLSWTQFDSKVAGFAAYKVYIGTSPLYDPYYLPDDFTVANTVLLAGFDVCKGLIAANVLKTWTIADIKRTMIRIPALTPATKYYILLRAVSTNGNSDFATLEVTTLA